MVVSLITFPLSMEGRRDTTQGNSHPSLPPSLPPSPPDTAARSKRLLSPFLPPSFPPSLPPESNGSVYFNVSSFDGGREGHRYGKLMPEALGNSELLAEGEGKRGGEGGREGGREGGGGVGGEGEREGGVECL